MVRALIHWALHNCFVVIVLALVIAGVGYYSFLNINVEAYPDPAPAVQELVALWPGYSAEMVERQVSIPLEVALAGMPGCKTVHSKSLFGLSHLRCIFHYDVPYEKARQEVINRLSMLNQPLPPGVTPQLSPANAIGEIFRYTLKSPKDAAGKDIYTLNDLKALQDWLIEREFRRVPGVIDVTSYGGTVKRYEIQPDPERMKKYGVTLAMLSNALSNGNSNTAGDYLIMGRQANMVISIGFIGGGLDPQVLVTAAGMTDPRDAARFLREQEQIRLRQIRDIVITSVNGFPVKIDNIVQGGPLPEGARSTQGVIVSHQTRLGRVSLDKAMDKEGKVWRRDDEKVQCIVLMRKGEQSLPTLEGVKKKVEELNQPGRLLPGVTLEPYYDREELVHLTTHTVTHNLVVGMGLVVVILMMFMSNVRTAIIVAVNIPLALLFAVAVLYLRGKSANLLSIGAVDFGIIVDSSVIMVENIYRNLAAGNYPDLPLRERIWRSVKEIDKALFFSTLIMVCAFIPLFTMHGAEGELFGPMAQTYAFALGGALLMALTLTPVLCLLFFRNLKAVPDNFLVRFLKNRYLWQLGWCLRHPWITLTVMVSLIAITIAWPMRQLGREFMPELDEGNMWIRAVLPVNVSLDASKDPVKEARLIISGQRYTLTKSSLAAARAAGVPQAFLAKVERLKGREFTSKDSLSAAIADCFHKEEQKRLQDLAVSHALQAPLGLSYPTLAPLAGDLAYLRHRKEMERLTALTVRQARFRNVYPEVAAVMVEMGRPDDGTDPGGYNNVEIFVPLKNERDWPVVERPNGERKVRTRYEIVNDLNDELSRKLPGIEWAFSQYIRDNVMEAISGVKGDNSVKIYGPDLEKLEELAEKTKNELAKVRVPRHEGLFSRIMRLFGKGGPAQTRSLYGLGIYHVMGQSNFEFVVDKEKCKRYGVQVGDVNLVVAAAIHGAALNQMVEGEKTFDITLRWPLARRQDPESILDIPVDVSNLTLTSSQAAQGQQTPWTGPSTSPSAAGTSVPKPTLVSQNVALPTNTATMRVPLRYLVSPVDKYGQPDRSPGASFFRPGGFTITREQGKRFIAIKYSVPDDCDLASAVNEVERRMKTFIQPPYYVDFGGEFEQMSDAERRFMFYIPASLVLIFLLLYIAFRSLLDAVVILSNVFDLAVGGIWALYLTGTNFSTSAAVGFVSLFGVAIMDGLLMISYFNALRGEGLPVREAILKGAGLRVRPVTMTALTAILGLLPAAMSTAIGSQTQKPLAIVVVGGMFTTLFLTRYLMPVLYSFYGHREPPEGAANLAH
jgi:Cu/Ag efflux pump CusA